MLLPVMRATYTMGQKKRKKLEVENDRNTLEGDLKALDRALKSHLISIKGHIKSFI